MPATPHTVTSASAGTAIASGAGTITAFTMNQPATAQVDDMTQLVLLDQAAAPTGPTPSARTLYAANMRALACELDPKPGFALTPGTTAPTWPKTIVPAGTVIAFSAGCWVQSCPANMTFT